MIGWILTEDGIPVITANNSIEIFKTKLSLCEYYAGSFGDRNNIKKVELIIK